MLGRRTNSNNTTNLRSRNLVRVHRTLSKSFGVDRCNVRPKVPRAASLSAKARMENQDWQEAPSPQKERRRLPPGVAALLEIKKYQSRFKLMIPTARIKRLIFQILREEYRSRRPNERIPVVFESNQNSEPNANHRYLLQKNALVAIHEAAEAYLVSFFEDVNLATIHRKRATIDKDDINFIKTLRSRAGLL
ncbi:hypothetical protein BCR33DRAFT_718308 [Rhizoclosmatium globosum]|uniref:Core Histone H2A/H2B/H3 domain-containing protein n=1 Tax=Rhizoclosmatium globosum TaxID=329046 RepID=A0A1Y2C6F8_9FUNG|nr:hypothetical protein BCR33DRAFT_718308 [Rhizoclosmatium globosum]|eukprot:ORY42619.1 hypothetical protein BCR33DRAFT_718308 [Rhizoclosmatium globosum]